jgi:probable rRNA maturation factor
MNRIDINASSLPMPPWKREARSFIGKVLDQLGKENWDLSVLLCDDPFIRDLNARYRGREEATDVLSFPLGEERRGRYLAGDLIISLDTLGENARYFGVSEDEEFRRLLIHGILHLDGRDHATNDPSEPMLQTQEKILTELGDEKIIKTIDGRV